MRISAAAVGGGYGGGIAAGMAASGALRMVSRRALLVAGGAAVAAGGGVYAAYAADIAAARERVSGGSRVVSSRFGAIEYGEAGEGPPLLMVHGTGGGFDQGLAFARPLVARGYRVIAPSRFGYLRSAFPAEPTSARQADAFADLLDALGIDRVPVVGGSAGALSAIEFAVRHPDRCAALLPVVPATYAPGGTGATDPGPLGMAIMEHALRSDFLFWLGLRLAPGRMTATLLATDPALVAAAGPEEQARVRSILWDILPVSERADGLLNDARLAGNPAPSDLALIRAPTLAISVEDDRFGTARAARHLAAEVAGARLVVYPSGGHVWVGHDAEMFAAIDSFLHEAGAAS